jgi:CMP/dCMP kinase
MKTTITIARQMGSGGSYIGQIIAKQLNLKYVDREVLSLAAKEFGCDTETVEARAERVRSFWQSIMSGLTLGGPDARYNPPPLSNFSDRELFDKQVEILKRIADKYDCVVIGWAGARVLPRHPGMFNVFCHAPKSFRARRLTDIYDDLTTEGARALMAESDQMREKYFLEMTGHEWASAKNYHVSIDTSCQPLEEIAEMIIDLQEQRRKRAESGT